MPMIVLHYIPSIDVSAGGVSGCLQQIVAELGGRVELHVVTHRTANMLELHNCTVHFIPRHYLVPHLCKPDFREVLRRVNPHIFHTNSCWEPLSSYCLLWAREGGCKTLYTLHGMMEPLIMKRHYYSRKKPALILYQKRALRAADCVVATSRRERDNFLAFGYNSNVVIIPNAVKTAGIKMKSTWKPTHTMLFLSRLHPVKGVEILLEAVASIRTMVSSYLLTIAGNGEAAYVAELKEKARRMGIDDMVRFTGEVTGVAKWELYRSADFFILPTRTENFGMVVAEALAAGTPVITTREAPWDMLETTGCGRWVSLDAEAIAQAILSMTAKSEAELETMGRKGRNMIELNFSDVRVADRMVALYNTLIEKDTDGRD